MENEFSEPTEVSDVLIAFPGSVMHLMPKMENISAEFKLGHSDWVLFIQDWFGNGISNPEFHMINGIDGETAYRHLSAIIGSFQPKHEHKEAAASYLCSLWFEKVVSGERVYGLPK